MKPLHTFYLLTIWVSLFAACKSSTKMADNNKASFDRQGSYSGIIPCADCEGITTTIVLNSDMTYSMRTQYLGKAENVNNQEGTFTWNKKNKTITLEGIKDGPRYFQVGENKLIQLDMQGQPITGPNAAKYELSKATNDITNKYWKLIEVMGKPVPADTQRLKEPHMILHTDGNRITGNGGCNNFSGTYTMEANNRIQFSPMAMTKMACINSMETEDQFVQALATADSYYANGDSLQLIRARMAPLARFVVVYLK